MKSLRTLSLVIGAPFTSTEAECRLILPNLCQHLQIKGTQPSRIETINITVGYDLFFQCDEQGNINMEESKGPLAVLDEVLASPAYSSLTTVRLTLACKKLGRPLDLNVQCQVETYFQQILPALRSNTGVSLTMRVTDYVI